MDRILGYLPNTVHVMFGWNTGPRFYGDYDHITHAIIAIPKEWIKHNKRGSWNEWEIKKTYKKKLMSQFGNDYGHSTEKLEILEWNQLENVAYMLRRANGVGFHDILEVAKTVNQSDVKYTHAVGV